MQEWWINRAENKERACNHYHRLLNDPKVMDEVNESVRNSSIYPSQNDEIFHLIHNLEKRYESTRIEILAVDTVSAIFTERGKENEGTITALNFASYKNPGGKFLEGSNAQEEALCHESDLFNILVNFETDYYKPNVRRLNGGLYDSNLIYTPKVLFTRNLKDEYADVITCAAPNTRAARRWNHADYEECYEALVWRILHVLYAAADNQCDTLILGAFGCGVFGNDPSIVMTTFLYMLKNYFNGSFHKVIFAVPDSFRNRNYPKMNTAYHSYDYLSKFLLCDPEKDNPPEVLKNEPYKTFIEVLKKVLTNDE